MGWVQWFQEAVRRDSDARQTTELKAVWEAKLCREWSNEGWTGFGQQEQKAIMKIKERCLSGFITIRPPDDGRFLDVPMQRDYNGSSPVIPVILADIPCSKFRVNQLLLCLNSLMGTAYSLRHPHLGGLLQSYVESPTIDFGTVYARLRPQWEHGDFDAFERRAEEAQKAYDDCRESLIKEKTIVSSRVPPRRLWDLYSNRAIHASLAMSRIRGTRDQHYKCRLGTRSFCNLPPFVALSHSWVDPSERKWEFLPVNRKQWGVPLPREISLEQARIEVLNLISQGSGKVPASDHSYAWLDLVCLRQMGPWALGESLRAREYALDIPTIGFVYQECESVIQYFCGLARPFVYGNEDYERHWLNRAWTLQELGSARTSITAGMAWYSPADPWSKRVDHDKPFMRRFDYLRHLNLTEFPLEIVMEMKLRHFVDPLDRVAGLLYPLKSEKLYTFDLDDTVEEAWKKLLGVLEPTTVASIATSYPFSGEGRSKFLPSWNQVQALNPSDFESTHQKLTFRMASTDEPIPIHRSGGHFRGTFPVWDTARLDIYSLRAAHQQILGISPPDKQKPQEGTITYRDTQRECIVPKGMVPGTYVVVMMSTPTALQRSKGVARVGLIGIWDKDTGSSNVFLKTASIAILSNGYRYDLGRNLGAVEKDIIFG